MTTRISVIIPTHNRQTLLCRAIDSVLAQTYPAMEIIVVNDGSTDDTSDTLDKKYRHKLTILEQTNQGVSAARNAGIRKSRGNWIALLDSDDEWLPTKLEKQSALIKNNSECVLCHCDEIWIRHGVRVNQMNKHQKSGGDIYQQCLPLCAISPSSVIIRKELFDYVGTFDESLPACEDYDLWLRICAQHRIDYLDEKLLIKYGGHQDQLSQKHWGMDRFRIRSLQKMLDTIELTVEKQDKTVSMLNRKTRILLKGAIKHNNAALVEECQNIIEKYDLKIPVAIDRDSNSAPTEPKEC